MPSLALSTSLRSVPQDSGVAAYSPSLLLDMTSGNQTLDPRITFSRASNATVTGPDGLIEYAPHNLLLDSEQFDDSVWTKANTSVVANTVIAPNGTLTGDLHLPNTTAAEHSVSQSFSFVSGTTYTISIYLKAAGYTQCRIRFQSTAFGGAAQSVDVDLTDGTAVAVSGTPIATITNVGNGWYRVTSTATASTTISAAISIFPKIDGSTTAAGDGTSGIFLWGAQLNVGALQPYYTTTVKNLLGYTQEFDNAAWTKTRSFIQTNLLTYSEQFDNAAWTKTNSTVTADGAISPDGTMDGDLFSSNATVTTSARDLRRNTTTTVSTTHTFTVYAKALNGNFIALSIRNAAAATNNIIAEFNIADGTVSTAAVNNGTATGGTASISAAGNGWYRCSVSGIADTSGTSLSTLIFGRTTGNSTSVPENTDLCYIWGAQLVQGSTAGDYQETVATTRAVMYPAPDSSITADKLVEDTTASATHQVVQTFSAISGTTYGASVYAKAGERTIIVLQFSAAFISTVIRVDLSDGSIISTSGSPVSSSVTSVGDGWYRVFFAQTANSTTTANLNLFTSVGGTTVYTGDGTSGLFIWGAQLSDSASLDPYVYNPVAAPAAAAYYGPRFGYDPVTLAPKGLLIEEQRTNLFTYSEQFDNAAWTKSSSTVTADAAVSPDGSMDADKLIANTTNTAHFLSQAISHTTGTSYTLTCFYKAAEVSFASLTFAAGFTGTQINAFYDLSTGVVGSTSAGSTATITPVGNGWYRCSLTITATATASSNIQIRLAASSTSAPFAGNDVDGAFIWGAQLEAGAFATRYIPTVASQVTRAADVAVMTGTNFSSWYNATEGTLFAQADWLGPSNNDYFFAINNGSSSNLIALGVSSSSVTRFIVTDGGVTQASVTGPTPVANTAFKIAGAYQVNNFAAATNGTLGTVDTSGTVPTGMTEVSLTSSYGNANLFNGHIQRIAYYRRRLTNAELQGITS